MVLEEIRGHVALEPNLFEKCFFELGFGRKYLLN